jgi:hypothetical protein
MTNLSEQAVVPPSESYRLIPLTQGQFAIVDIADFEWLNQWRWFASWGDGFYARRRVRGKNLLMHREILQPRKGYLVDHRNGNTLDNRRENLREATTSVNAINRRIRCDNTSGYVGVKKNGNGWCASVSVGGRRISLGTFSLKEDAVFARLAGESRYYKNSVRKKSKDAPIIATCPVQERLSLRIDNTSGYVGVSRKSEKTGVKVWRARVHVNGIEKCLGYFDSAKEASDYRAEYLSHGITFP